MMVKVLEEKIDDKKFISIIKRMLKAGFVENWVYYKTYSGTPQGGVISPILANIFLNELDEHIENLMQYHNRGKTRKDNLAYIRLKRAKQECGRRIDKAKSKGDLDAAKREILRWKELQNAQLEMPSKEQYDPEYRRLRYYRYADDFLLGYVGSKAEARQIYSNIKMFVEDQLKLEIAEDKSGIKHAPSEGCVFLGYVIDLKPTRKTIWYSHNGIRAKKRTMQQNVSLRIPEEKKSSFVVKNAYGNYATKKSTHRAGLLNMSDLEIVLKYNAELRGFAQYYALANNAKTELSAVVDLGRVSMLRTLASKHKCSVRNISRKFKQGSQRGVIANGKFYKFWALKDLRKSSDTKHDMIPNTAMYSGRTELNRRLKANLCEYCGAEDGKFEVHHVRKLKDIKEGKEKWQRLMIARNRKTMVLCDECHGLLHAGKLPDNRFNSCCNVESRVQ